MSESNALGDCLHLLARLMTIAFPAYLGSQSVENGSLGGPRFHVLHGDYITALSAHLLALIVAKSIYDVNIARCFGVNSELAVAVVVH